MYAGKNFKNLSIPSKTVKENTAWMKQEQSVLKKNNWRGKGIYILQHILTWKALC